MRRPYNIRDDDDSVDVVGHHHPFVQFHVGEMARDALPHRLRHAVKDRVVEQQFAFVGYYRHKVRPRLGVIVSPQADGTPALSPVEGAVVFVRIGSFHDAPRVLDARVNNGSAGRLAHLASTVRLDSRRGPRYGEWTALSQVLRDCRKYHLVGRLGACLIVSQVGPVVNSVQSSIQHISVFLTLSLIGAVPNRPSDLGQNGESVSSWPHWEHG